MQLSTDDVTSIVSEVWTSMLGTDAVPAEGEFTFDGTAVAGSVGVTGEAECLISMEMDLEGARKFAGLMFGLETDDVSEADLTDAAGELTNMVGGNIKSLLPEPSQLSLPVVARGAIPPTLSVVGGKVLLQGRYMSDGHPIFVTVWSRPSA